MSNRHAQALGRLGKGIKKTMSHAALEQRKQAALISAEKRRKCTLGDPLASSVPTKAIPVK